MSERFPPAKTQPPAVAKQTHWCCPPRGKEYQGTDATVLYPKTPWARVPADPPCAQALPGREGCNSCRIGVKRGSPACPGCLGSWWESGPGV